MFLMEIDVKKGLETLVDLEELEKIGTNLFGRFAYGKSVQMYS